MGAASAASGDEVAGPPGGVWNPRIGPRRVGGASSLEQRSALKVSSSWCCCCSYWPVACCSARGLPPPSCFLLEHPICLVPLPARCASKRLRRLCNLLRHRVCFILGAGGCILIDFFGEPSSFCLGNSRLQRRCAPCRPYLRDFIASTQPAHLTVVRLTRRHCSQLVGGVRGFYEHLPCGRRAGAPTSQTACSNGDLKQRVSISTDGSTERSKGQPGALPVGFLPSQKLVLPPILPPRPPTAWCTSVKAL